MWGVRVAGRLITLRPITESDLAEVAHWSADPAVMRLAGLPYRAFGPAAVRTWWENADTDERTVHWGVEWQGRLVGRTALIHLDREHRRAWSELVIGGREAWRHGLGTEAVSLRTHYAFHQLNLFKLLATYLDGNAAGAEILHRAGYQDRVRLREQVFRDGQWWDEVTAELLREDWLRASG